MIESNERQMAGKRYELQIEYYRSTEPVIGQKTIETPKQPCAVSSQSLKRKPTRLLFLDKILWFAIDRQH